MTITSATKAYNIPGLRCGAMHFGSEALREQFRMTVPDRMLGITNRFGIEATIVAWRQCADWLSAVLEVLERNRSRLVDWMAREVPTLRWHPPEATYLAWLDCTQVVPADALPYQFLLETARVALSDGAPFRRAGARHVRLHFGTSPEIMEQVLARIAGAVA